MKYYLFFLSLFFLLSCKSTTNSTIPDDTAIETAEEVQLTKNRKGFTYLKNGQEYRTKRKLKGTLSSEVTDSLFSLVPEEEDLPKPNVLLINYYPARTPSNSTGSCDGTCLKNKYKQAERRINKLENTAVIYLNRPGSNLGKYAVITDWKEDLHFLMERYFVPHPQLGNSYAVLCSNGDYEAYLGEFPRSYLLETFDRVYADCFRDGAAKE